MTERLIVPFAGEGAGIGELTWGQQEIWPAMQRERSSLPIGGVLPLPPGLTADDVAADLRFLMNRHSALRTRLRFDADGRARQVVAASGEALLEVVDAGEADPAEVGAALHRRYDEQVFDYAGEWPIRWAVIVARGVATHLVSVICHLAADGMGVLALLDDLAGRDRVTGLPKGPVTALQPLELGRWQRSPAGIRCSDLALRHWERLLLTIPARRFTGSADMRQPRYWQAFYDSPASHLAIQAIAARVDADTSTILLAAYAVALARVTGSSPAVLQVVVNNRFRPGLAQVVSPLCDFSLCVIDVSDTTFDAVVARAYASAMSAYKNAYCDPVRRAELVERIGRERGEEIDIRCFVNDRRMQSRPEPGERAPGPDEVRAAVPQSTLTWGYRNYLPNERCYLHVNNVPDTVNYELRVDTRYVSPADMEAFLLELEAVVVEAAYDPGAPTRIRSSFAEL